MPDQILLPVAKLTIQAADKQKPATISILAYSGGLMRVSGWGDLIIDTDGLDVSGQVKLLVDHDQDLQGVLGAGQGRVYEGQVFVDGTISRASSQGQQVIAMARDGVAWEASVGVQPDKVERYGVGGKVTVNGREITSDEPFTVIRTGQLRETSILALGADAETSVSIAAKLKGKTMGTENTPTLETIRAEEAERVKAIDAVCGAEHSAIRAKAVAEGWDANRTELEALRAQKAKWDLETLRASRPKVPAAHTGGRYGSVSGQEVVEAAAMSLVWGDSSTEKIMGAENAQRARDVRATSFQDILRAGCTLHGIDERLSRDDLFMVRAGAFTGHSLASDILSNTANKQLQAIWPRYNRLFAQVAKRLSAKDFKTHTGYRLLADATLAELSPEGQVEHATLDAGSYTYSVDTYAKMYAITRKDLINDDLGAFSDLPQTIARGAALKIENLGWTLVLANTGNFFHADNSNYISGGASALDGTALGTAVKTMRQLADAEGEPILVEPKLLAVPPELEETADELHVSTNIVITGTTDLEKPSGNIFAGKYKPLVVPYLSNANYTGNSATAWYLFGESSDIAAFGLAFLNQQEMPTIESSDADFNQLGIQFRGFLDLGVAQVDPQGAVKSAGA